MRDQGKLPGGGDMGLSWVEFQLAETGSNAFWASEQQEPKHKVHRMCLGHKDGHQGSLGPKYS